MQWNTTQPLKKWNNAIWSNMDKSRDYHTKWGKSDWESQISYDIIYMWNQKKNHRNELVYKTKQMHRHRKQTYGHQKENVQMDKLGAWD